MSKCIKILISSCQLNSNYLNTTLVIITHAFFLNQKIHYKIVYNYCYQIISLAKELKDYVRNAMIR
ncbi:hypothetical protein GLOIN_2v1591123 [Rhizophagus irregularis DAOM 181602=DAOM 197198]|uniref:Uncharacterized protein n=1 Tax=Rhizophagus irregularis (strain DAOM 181602 / DAOM 197198 / MUCL 43194) TaxID=747089 RepID=A0A2P4Q5R4_RHIID|nr:hypothetical protein GLOIN_2v1591123 [Rhizophagus irregularis DAOM 181602=DAOM 197198]POG72989.1 hypothetical protein GLOIN_2v1591123 [Rhizophagus irregularis DAOM 181602=DAOM 197198]|eukprot:XP_025179855.1 hypothetical protein GLOIN_2v1591123 [Rhizophagus irregularis DAOM 181602=DAOM 197198]